MPYINIKLVKDQITPEQRQAIIEGITDLAVHIMGRERHLTVITLDELEQSQWVIGGKTLAALGEEGPKVYYACMKISKGTSHPEEMAKMMKAVRTLMDKILGVPAGPNYFVIEELNPDGWGFDGIPMTIRNQMV